MKSVTDSGAQGAVSAQMRAIRATGSKTIELCRIQKIFVAREKDLEYYIGNSFRLQTPTPSLAFLTGTMVA